MGCWDRKTWRLLSQSMSILTILAIAIYHLYLPYIWDKQRISRFSGTRPSHVSGFKWRMWKTVSSVLAVFLLGSGYHGTGENGLKVFRCRPSNWNPNSAVLHIITMFTQKMSLLHAHCMLGSWSTSLWITIPLVFLRNKHQQNVSSMYRKQMHTCSIMFPSCPIYLLHM